MVEADRQKVIAALKAVGGGSLLRGWRVELDPDGSLDVSFLEFCRACKKLRVAVDAAALFGEDSPNELTLDELAPREGALVLRFRTWLTERFGSPGEMFTALEPPEGDGRMDRREFVTGIAQHGFECPEEMLSELFNLLDLFGVESVAMEDIMFLDMNPKTRQGAIQKAKMRGQIEHQHLLSELYKEMKGMDVHDGHRLAPRGWHAPALERLPEVMVEKRMQWRKKESKHRKEVVAAFMQHITATYGNGVRGWRRGLDPGATFLLKRADLLRYCRRHNMALCASTLWSILDKDGDGYLRMEEIEPRAAASLARFWKWTSERNSTCAQSWAEIMVVARSKLEERPPVTWKSSSSLQSKVFLQAVTAMGWPAALEPGAGASLVNGLDLTGCGIVSKRDLEWLDRWKAPEWLCAVPDEEAWRQLRAILLQTYGKPLKAWRTLDEDDSNVASWDEFERMCNLVAFKGNRGGAWRALDTDISGSITLTEWHPPSARLLRSFKDCMYKNFGSVKLAFKTMDTDGSGSLSFSELRRACKRLKWEGDVRLIFACLNMPIKAGERTLSYKDLAFLDRWAPDDEDEEPQAPARSSLRSSSSAPGLGQRPRPRPPPLAATYGDFGDAPLSPTSSSSSSRLPSVGSPAPATPAGRRIGVGCYREEALASLRSWVGEARREAEELAQDHPNLGAIAKGRLVTPLPRMRGPRRRAPRSACGAAADAESGGATMAQGFEDLEDLDDEGLF